LPGIFSMERSCGGSEKDRSWNISGEFTVIAARQEAGRQLWWPSWAVLQPSEGNIYIALKKLHLFRQWAGKPAHAQFCFVFQQAELIPALSVLENCSLQRVFRWSIPGSLKAKALTLLESFGLKEYSHLKSKSYPLARSSGCYRQGTGQWPKFSCAMSHISAWFRKQLHRAGYAEALIKGRQPRVIMITHDPRFSLRRPAHKAWRWRITYDSRNGSEGGNQ